VASQTGDPLSQPHRNGPCRSHPTGWPCMFVCGQHVSSVIHHRVLYATIPRNALLLSSARGCVVCIYVTLAGIYVSRKFLVQQ
jgi:hypothetical protein